MYRRKCAPDAVATTVRTKANRCFVNCACAIACSCACATEKHYLPGWIWQAQHAWCGTEFPHTCDRCQHHSLRVHRHFRLTFSNSAGSSAGISAGVRAQNFRSSSFRNTTICRASKVRTHAKASVALLLLLRSFLLLFMRVTVQVVPDSMKGVSRAARGCLPHPSGNIRYEVLRSRRL